MLASDLNNPNFMGASNPDSALAVDFSRRRIKNEFRSAESKELIYDEVDYIKIQMPGNVLSVIETPVRPEHKRRFSIQWTNYQNSLVGEQRNTGTPLSACPFLTPDQVEELRGVRFYTVEMLALASDSQIQSVGMIGGMAPNSLRNMAKTFLETSAIKEKASQETDDKASMVNTIDQLHREIEALKAGKTETRVNAKPTVDRRKDPEVIAARKAKIAEKKRQVQAQREVPA